MRRAAALLLLAGIAAFFPAEAWPAEPTSPARSHAPLLFSADEVQYDQQLGLVIAKGNVEISEQDQILLADTVTYNQPTDTVTASGHVSLLLPSGDVVFADFVELHDDMRDGFIKDVRMLLSDRSRLAGNTGRRVAGKRIEIRRGVYSPCELCREDPTRPPVWQIKAEQVVDDRELQIVEYRDAIMEIEGVPVLYTPYFSHPEPSVKRQSGFLAPSLGTGNTLGFHIAVPYYWVIAPDKDATFRPIFTTSGGTVLDGEYRERFGNGQIQNEGSIALGSKGQSAIADTGPPTSELRGHFFGIGEFDLNQNWRSGYLIQRESDQTYMLRYHFPTPTNFLTSHLYAEDFGENSYANISAYGFQSLIAGVGDSVQPFATPVASYDWLSRPDPWGGRLRLNANFLNLMRRTGSEIRRLSGGTEWQLPFNGAVGDRFRISASLRSDGYYSDHVALNPTLASIQTSIGTVQVPSNVGTSTQWSGRVFPQAALQWRWPWVRTGSNGSAVIEPIAALIAAPRGENPQGIPNEDSQGFEFDESSLFVPDRFAGFDRVDSGQRADYGLKGELHTQALGSWQTLVGQSYRFNSSTPFLPGSGLEERLSDVVGRILATPDPYLDFYYRFRVDGRSLALRRQETGASAGPTSLRGSISFISIAPVPGVSTVQTGDQISVGIYADLTRYWSLALNDTRSISSGGATINSGAALTYRDDCIAVVGSVAQSGIRVGDVRPGVSMLVTFVFKNLGEVAARVF